MSYFREKPSTLNVFSIADQTFARLAIASFYLSYERGKTARIPVSFFPRFTNSIESQLPGDIDEFSQLAQEQQHPLVFESIDSLEFFAESASALEHLPRYHPCAGQNPRPEGENRKKTLARQFFDGKRVAKR